MARPCTKIKDPRLVLTPKQLSNYWKVPDSTLRQWSYVTDKENWRYQFYRKLHDIAMRDYANVEKI